jgi:hypothetical protein
MKDTLSVILDAEKEDRYSIYPIILRIDRVLLEHGWKYSGIMNMYIPNEGVDGDESFYTASDAIMNDEIIKNYNPSVFVGTNTNACELESINVSGMSAVSVPKFTRYYKYYKQNKEYVHEIVVDENNNIRAGFTTYLIAKETGDNPNIIRVRSNQPIKKVVSGQHIIIKDGIFRGKKKKTYIWEYTLDTPVIPGDVLEVITEKGSDYMVVDKVAFVAGESDCNKYKKVLSNTTCNIMEFIEDREIDPYMAPCQSDT